MGVGGRWPASRGLPDGQTGTPLSIPRGFPWHREEMGTQGPVATGVPPGRCSCHRPHLRPPCGQASALEGLALLLRPSQPGGQSLRTQTHLSSACPGKGPQGSGGVRPVHAGAVLDPGSPGHSQGRIVPQERQTPSTETQAHVPAGHRVGRTQLILCSHWPPLRY